MSGIEFIFQWEAVGGGNEGKKGPSSGSGMSGANLTRAITQASWFVLGCGVF